MSDKLDIAELKQLRNEMLEAGFARETNTYHALRDELSELIFDHHEELIALAERQHNRDTHIGTHFPGCYASGYRHYSCALQEIERIKAENAELQKKLIAAYEDVSSQSDEILDLQA